MDLAKAVRDPWVWGQVALLLLIGVAAPVVPRMLNLGALDPLFGLLDPVSLRFVGLPLLAAGLLVVAWGLRSLGRNLTPGVEPLPGGELVCKGAYAWVRHPIYLGLILILTGYTLLLSNWRLAMIALWASASFFGGKARAEERHLAQRFPSYGAYQQAVPRIMPWGARRP